MIKYQLALVTGATSGIGEATGRLLAHKGINLILSGRNQQKLSQLQESFSDKAAIQTIQADLSQRQGRETLIEIIHKQAPDLVINNAGLGLYGEALTYSMKDQVELLEVNGKAVLELTLEAARTLISMNKKGVVLNISSAAAFHVLPTMAVYAASKAFVNSFSQAFDFEMKKHGIRVLTLCPGMVATEFQKRAGAQFSNEQLEMMSPQYVAEQIWRQLERLNPISIIDWKYRFLTYFSRLFPKSWCAKLVQLIIESRLPTQTIIRIPK